MESKKYSRVEKTNRTSGAPRRLLSGLVMVLFLSGSFMACAPEDSGGEEFLALALPAAAASGLLPDGGTDAAPQVALASSLSANLNTAKSLVIAPSGAFSRNGSSGGNRLYVLNADDSLTELSVSSDGNTSVVPSDITDTKTFVLLHFNSSVITHEDTRCNYVAVRKSDSSLFCVENAAPSYLQRGSVKFDGSGNLIYIYGSGELNRLDFSNPENPVKQTVLSVQTDGSIRDFFVNNSGDLMVNMGSLTAAYRIYKRSGGIVPFSATPGFYNDVARGPVNHAEKFYTTNTNGVPIYEIDVNGTQSIYYQDPSPPYHERQACASYMYRTDAKIECMRVLPINDRVDFVTLITSSVATMGTLTTISPITTSAVTETHYFDGGMVVNATEGIVRFRRSPAGETILLSAATYGISSLQVSSAGAITFYGRRFSDGAFILGSIPAGSDTPTIATSDIGEPTAILPLN